MKAKDTIRAWKDEEYRASLSSADLASLEESPVGAVELDDEDLAMVGGGKTESFLSLGCCPEDSTFGGPGTCGICSWKCGTSGVTCKITIFKLC